MLEFKVTPRFITDDERMIGSPSLITGWTIMMVIWDM